MRNFETKSPGCPGQEVRFKMLVGIIKVQRKKGQQTTGQNLRSIFLELFYP